MRTLRFLVDHSVPRLVFESVMPVSPQKLWEFHSSVEALTRLSPPGATVRILNDDLEVREGALHLLSIRRGLIPLRWEALISDVIPGRRFRDTAVRSPFKSWTHLHEFLDHPSGSLLRDTVDFTFHLPFMESLLAKDVTRLFHHRHRVTHEMLRDMQSEG